MKFIYHCSVYPDLKSQHNNIRKVAESWVAAMDHETKTGILTHYGEMPGLEHEYWRLGSGPAWCWWVLAILPLDHQAQVGHAPVTDWSVLSVSEPNSYPRTSHSNCHFFSATNS